MINLWFPENSKNPLYKNLVSGIEFGLPIHSLSITYIFVPFTEKPSEKFISRFPHRIDISTFLRFHFFIHYYETPTCSFGELDTYSKLWKYSKFFCCLGIKDTFTVPLETVFPYQFKTDRINILGKIIKRSGEENRNVYLCIKRIGTSTTIVVFNRFTIQSRHNRNMS